MLLLMGHCNWEHSFNPSGTEARRMPVGSFHCTNQQHPQRGGAVSEPVRVRSKCLLAFLMIPVTLGTPHIQSFFRRASP